MARRELDLEASSPSVRTVVERLRGFLATHDLVAIDRFVDGLRFGWIGATYDEIKVFFEAADPKYKDPAIFDALMAELDDLPR